VILEGEFEHPIDEDFEAKAIELGGQYELVQREGNGLGLAFRTLYEFALQDHSPDEILFGPVAKFVRGRDSATINTFFVGQVGDHVEIDSLELKVNWRLKHEVNERWALGIEGYSEIEDLVHAGSFNEQSHRLGPVAYYEFPPRRRTARVEGCWWRSFWSERRGFGSYLLRSISRLSSKFAPHRSGLAVAQKVSSGSLADYRRSTVGRLKHGP
jgi:Putative MetA-pathway of phenol degradation